MSHRKAARFLFGGAGLLLVFSACSSDNNSPSVGGASANTLPAIVGASSSVDTNAATTTVAPGAGATLPPAVDATDLLHQAVAATGTGYHFNQTASVDGTVALTIDGDRLPSGARVAVSSDVGKVFYVITPDGTWLMPENGEWEADDSDPPTVDPIASLNAPTSAAIASNDGTTAQLAVTVPKSALGIPGDGDAALQVTIVGGALTNITYSTTTADGKAAVANVVIGPPVDTSPVVPPI